MQTGTFPWLRGSQPGKSHRCSPPTPFLFVAPLHTALPLLGCCLLPHFGAQPHPGTVMPCPCRASLGPAVPPPPPRPRRTSLFPSFSLRPGRDEPEARSSLPSPSWGAWPGDAVTPSSPARGAWCSRAGNQDFIPNAVIRTVTLLRETNRGLKHVMSSLEHTVHLWRTDTFTYISSL